MKRRIFSLIVLFGSWCSCARSQEKLPDCEWCGAVEAPAGVTWTTNIAGRDEPGERMTIRGKVLRSDGRTPAAGIILYVYHTNAKGIYEKKGNETGNGRRHGHLRGWIKTNEQGEYEFHTIRPASYPNQTAAAHVHITVKEPDKDEYWIDDFMFEGDPLLTRERRRQLQNRGGSGIITLDRQAGGSWIGTRNIVLP
jgi:protocatechuate 3,4-dioxygenase beta subunit